MLQVQLLQGEFKMIKGIAEIFKSDLKAIINNPIVIVALIIIVCLPSLYSLINIQAIWNPYNNTSNMKIAIVDNDLGYTFQGVNYNFGKNLSNELAANNTNLNWQFVDENTARYGVNTGEYYAAFIIPSNFTENLLSFGTSNPKQAQIEYLINEKMNPIMPRIINTTALEIQNQVNSAVDQGKINLTTTQATALQTQLSTMQEQISALQAQNSSAANQPNTNLTAANPNSTTSANPNGLITFSSGNQNDPNVNPMQMNEELIFPVDNYGSAIAPFYIALSLFIGSIVAVAMLSTRVRKSKQYHPVSVYFGKMGLFILISILQALVITLVILNLHVQLSSATLFTFTALYIGLCFMIITYSLVSVFGSIGKAFAIIILVLQVMTTGGTYPVQMLSSFYQNVYPYLPMTYAIDALRQVVAGVLWNNYWYNLEILTIFPAIVLIFALLMKEEMDKKAEQAEQNLKKSGLF